MKDENRRKEGAEFQPSAFNIPPSQKGLLEGASRILRELLRSPKVKESLFVLMRELDPQNAPLLIRSLTQSDPGLTFSALAAFPRLINAATEAGLEITSQAVDVAPALRDEFLAQFAADVDAEKLGRLCAEILILKSGILSSENPGMREAKNNFVDNFAAGFFSSIKDEKQRIAETFADLIFSGLETAAGKINEDIAREDSLCLPIVEKATRGIGEIAVKNPEVIRQVAAPLAAAWRDILKFEKEINDKPSGVDE